MRNYNIIIIKALSNDIFSMISYKYTINLSEENLC